MIDPVLILMRRDGLSEAEALEIVLEAKDAVEEALINGEDPERVFVALTGLDPAYIWDLQQY